MPYVTRKSDGKILAVSVIAVDHAGWEYIDGNDSEYLQFMQHSMLETSMFRESDIQLARVLEDLVAILIEREILRFTDLPEPAQKRLLERKAMRNHARDLNLIDDQTLL